MSEGGGGGGGGGGGRGGGSFDKIRAGGVDRAIGKYERRKRGSFLRYAIYCDGTNTKYQVSGQHGNLYGYAPGLAATYYYSSMYSMKRVDTN